MNDTVLKMEREFKAQVLRVDDWCAEGEKILTRMIHFEEFLDRLATLTNLKKSLPAAQAELRAAGKKNFGTPEWKKLRARIKRMMDKGAAAHKFLVETHQAHQKGYQRLMDEMADLINEAYEQMRTEWRPEVEGHFAGNRPYYAARELLKMPALPATALIYDEYTFAGEPPLTQKVKKIHTWRKKIIKRLPRQAWLEARRDIDRQKIEAANRELWHATKAQYDYYEAVYAGREKPDYANFSWNDKAKEIEKKITEIVARQKEIVARYREDCATLEKLSQGKAPADKIFVRGYDD